MGNVIGPGQFSSGDHRGGRGVSPLRAFVDSFVNIVRQYGVKGLAALVFAALFAFAPLTLLYWFNEVRLATAVTLSTGQRAVVKPARFQEEQEEEEPGETALLQVVCEIDGGRPLLVDEDSRREQGFMVDSYFVRRERVYLRPAGMEPEVPYGLLGKPPVSVWLPAGDYELLVVYETPGGEAIDESDHRGFPWMTEFAEYSLENQQKTVCRIPLPHYGWNEGPRPAAVGDETSTDAPPPASQPGWTVATDQPLNAIPTPGGYVLALDEPVVHHDAEHHGCTFDRRQRRSILREWTRDQLAAVRNGLPDDAMEARTQLTSLIDALEWREFFEGWYCYAAAGIAGLVFTRWGALAILEPWRRGESFGESVALMIKIFLASAAIWFIFRVLTD